ncbi:MAG: hypothetical protein KJ645_02805, partial [Planctomycetes bacterium]|nr:hypothetical protein [Planctomycetota bacterium]
MSVDLIAGLAGEQYTTEISRMHFKNHIPSPTSTAPKNQGIMDQFEISKSAKEAYEEEDKIALIDKFRFALVRFSNYALEAYGYKPEAGAKEAYYGLLELAKLANVDAPVDLRTRESADTLLASFQDKWGFDEKNGIDDIFNMMVSEFKTGQYSSDHSLPEVDGNGSSGGDDSLPALAASGNNQNTQIDPSIQVSSDND